TTILAPSAAKRRAIPSPKPEPEPVMTATLSWRRMEVLPSAVADRDGLDLGKAAQPLEGFLAAETGMLDAAERQFDPAARAVVIDEDRAAPRLPREPHLPVAVPRPDRSHQAEFGTVGQLHRLVLVGEGEGRQNRAEDLLLREGDRRRNIAQQQGREIEA